MRVNIFFALLFLMFSVPFVKADLSETGNVTVGGARLSVNGVDYQWPATDGSSGLVLTTDGSANLSWQSPGSGVDTQVSSQSFSAASSAQLSLGGYQAYRIVFVATTSASTQIYFRLNGDTSSNYKWVCTGADAGGAGATSGSSGTTLAEISANTNNVAGETITAELLLRRWPLGASVTSWVGDVEFTRTGGNPLALTCGGKYTASADPSSISFAPESGTMSGSIFTTGRTP